MAASDSTVWMPREVRAYFDTLIAIGQAREKARSDSRKPELQPHADRESSQRRARNRAALKEAQRFTPRERRGQAIALGMLVDLERVVDKRGRMLADRCGFEFRPRGSRQDNVVERYLKAVRALSDPEIESGFLSILSAIVAEITFDCVPDSESAPGAKYFQKILKLRPERLAIHA